MRRCSGCPNLVTGSRRRCDSCRDHAKAERNRRFRAKHPEYASEYAKRWRAMGPTTADAREDQERSRRELWRLECREYARLARMAYEMREARR